MAARKMMAAKGERVYWQNDRWMLVKGSCRQRGLLAHAVACTIEAIDRTHRQERCSHGKPAPTDRGVYLG